MRAKESLFSSMSSALRYSSLMFRWFSSMGYSLSLGNSGIASLLCLLSSTGMTTSSGFTLDSRLS